MVYPSVIYCYQFKMLLWYFSKLVFLYLSSNLFGSLLRKTLAMPNILLQSRVKMYSKLHYSAITNTNLYWELYLHKQLDKASPHMLLCRSQILVWKNTLFCIQKKWVFGCRWNAVLFCKQRIVIIRLARGCFTGGRNMNIFIFTGAL